MRFDTSMLRVLPFASPFVIGAVSLMLGCASVPPRELLDARAAFRSAEKSDASEIAPADVQNARESLARAERSFLDDGDDTNTRSYAYVAEREAELSMARASTHVALEAKNDGEKRLLTTAADLAEKKAKELEEEKARLATTTDKLEAERKARREAEAKMKEAIAKLAAIADVKDDSRGVVITLPGGVLFESGKSILIGTAQERLMQVAEALRMNKDAMIIVEGHTDSQGDEQLNQRLSEDRANAVRDFLVTHGVASDRIRAVGRGESRPIADNRSPEGRATNRRVEIVVQNRGAVSMN